MGFSQPQTTSPQYTPSQQAFQNASANFLQNQVQSGGLPAYPGPLTAGLTPGQQGIIGGQTDVAAMAPGATAQGLGTLGFTAAGGYLNDPFTANLVQQTRNQFYTQDVPQLTAPFIAAGQTGYSTPGASTLAAAGAQMETGLAAIQEQAYQTEQAAQQQAALALPALGTGVSGAALAAATMPQQTQQAAYTNAYNEYLRQQQGPWTAALGIPSLTGAGTQTLYAQSPFASAMGAALPMFMMGGQAASFAPWLLGLGALGL